MIWRSTFRLPFFATVVLVGLLEHPASAGESACSPYVEDQPRWNTAMLRPNTNAFQECTLTENTYAAVVRAWLAGGEQGGEPLKSLGLGRLVTYPWLSTTLAEAATTHPQWYRSRGKSHRGDINGLVASILSSDEILARLAIPFEGSRYRVTGVSVEKVLVAPAAKILPGHPNAKEFLPYDAQTWLVLAFDP